MAADEAMKVLSYTTGIFKSKYSSISILGKDVATFCFGYAATDVKQK